MIREKMLEARKLIENKQYLEARKILQTVEHPKATEWLRKLDEIELSSDLGDPFASSTPAAKQVGRVGTVIAPLVDAHKLMQEAI